MAKFFQMVIGLSVIFLLFSCSSKNMVKKSPPPKFQGLVLTKDIDDSGVIDVPVGSTSEFDVEDKQAVALLTLENMTGSHNLRWEWVAPDGSVYLATQNYPVKANEGKYLPTVTAWYRISLKDEPASNSPGKWSVKIFIDDELIDSKSFMVSALVDPLLLPAGVISKPYPKD